MMRSVFPTTSLPKKLLSTYLAGLCCFALLNLGGCDPEPSNEEHGDRDDGQQWTCEGDPRYVPFMIGMVASGSTATATFLAANPPEPEIGKNHWKLRFSDLHGAPLTGLNIKISTWMPDHKHASPSDGSIVVTEDLLNPGEYSFDKIDMHMAGFWEIKFAITYADANVDAIQFTMCHNP